MEPQVPACRQTLWLLLLGQPGLVLLLVHQTSRRCRSRLLLERQMLESRLKILLLLLLCCHLLLLLLAGYMLFLRLVVVAYRHYWRRLAFPVCGHTH